MQIPNLESESPALPADRIWKHTLDSYEQEEYERQCWEETGLLHDDRAWDDEGGYCGASSY